MATLDEQRRHIASAIRNARAAENELTPPQARLFVRSLQRSWNVPNIAWSVRESYEQFVDARRLLHAAGLFRELDGNESPDALACYRRAGELFEWLARGSDVVTSDVPVELLAAGAYQLAGLPAMATALLRRSQYQLDATQIFAALLSANFDAVLAHSANFWRNHLELTGRSGSELLLPGVEEEEGGGDELELESEVARGEEGDAVLPGSHPRQSRMGQYVIVELVRAVGLSADSIRRGNEGRLKIALAKLSALNTLATRLTNDELWILISLIEATAHRFAENSLHGRVARFAASSLNLQQRLWRFAREQFARGRGILWISQARGIDRLIETSNFALCTPTGSGKTLVANLALVKELLLVENSEEAPLGIYLVPSRALAGEVETKLTSEFREDLIVTGLYGGTDWGITDYWLTGSRPVVLIATVEKAEALLRYVGHLIMRRLRLLVIDEAHQVVNDGDINAMRDLAAHRSRSMRLETMVSRLLLAKPNVSRIALTAVAGGAALPVAQWMEGRAGANPVGLGYRSSRQLIGALHCDPRRAPQVLLDMLNGHALYVRGRDEAVYLPLRIPAMQLPAVRIRNSLTHYTQLYTLWTAIHLLEDNRRILISVAQKPELLMKRFAEAFALPGWEKLPPYVAPKDLSLRALYEEAVAACIDYCGPDSYESALLKRGIATSHGQMPQRLRRLMTALIENRVCPITLATATLTEGVNLPFDVIFVTSLERRGFNPETKRPDVIPMSVSEFRNLAGRAGRPGAAEAIEGMTLVALPQSPTTTASGTVPSQRRQILRARETYDELLSRLQRDDEVQSVAHSPLAVLLYSIRRRAASLLGLQDEARFHAWLESVLPEDTGKQLAVESHLELDQLGDSLDELDGFLLAATQELARSEGRALSGIDLETHLKELWRRTFARVAAAQEGHLEVSFIKRGRAFVERLYPDDDQRRRLYQYGFTPYVGRRFEPIAPELIAELRGAAEYGKWSAEERFQLLMRLGERVRVEPGIGFRSYASEGDRELVSNWSAVLGWWMQRPGAQYPQPAQLRSWQRFVSENIEFRLGVAVGAAVAQVWGETADSVEIPTLASWRGTTDLPWIGFWFRELLRWGTLDPFVAFAMAQGLSQTREQGAARRAEFEVWLSDEGFDSDSENLIDPQRFLAWHRSLSWQAEVPETVSNVNAVQLTAADGRRRAYDVRPIVHDGDVVWLDAAGYSIARSKYSASLLTAKPERHDYEITVDSTIAVRRTF